MMGRIEDEAESYDSFKRIITARMAITEKHGDKKPATNISDSMPCPVCQSGTLNYSISGYNGHIHAKCTTDKCVYWME